MPVIFDPILAKLRWEASAGVLIAPSFSGIVNFSGATELTISSGAVTITQSIHSIDTEGDAASDDLATINGGSDGDMLRLMLANDARAVVLKNGTGNILCSTGGDENIPAAGWVDLIHDGSDWRVQLPNIL